MTNETLLFVDDEPNILQSMERQFRKRFTTLTAESGDEALAILKKKGTVAVIVSDMRMPGMNGIQLLTQVKNLYPDTVRIMLTGNADQETAMKAVNTGEIFRFLTKPCATPVLITSIALALRQYRLLIAERELLNKTLKGSINMMSELLSLTNSTAFSSGYRVKETVKQLATMLALTNTWQFEVAALMSQVGCITLPPEILTKYQAGVELSQDEQETFENHPQVGAKLVSKIPRLEAVAAMIKNQLVDYEDYYKDDLVKQSDDIQIGGQILKTVINYDLLLCQGTPQSNALGKMSKMPKKYNPRIVELLTQIRVKAKPVQIVSIKFQDVVPGMIAEEDVLAKNGTLIIPKGQEITWPIIQGLHNFLKHIGIQEPIIVSLEETDIQDSL